MKRLIVLIGLLLATGCATVSKPDACAAAETAYLVYLAIINADGKPSQDQIIAAQAASIVLVTQCGWIQPTATKQLKGYVVCDKNSVPVLVPAK